MILGIVLFPIGVCAQSETEIRKAIKICDYEAAISQIELYRLQFLWVNFFYFFLVVQQYFL